MARRGQELTLLAIAERLEGALGGWIDPDDRGATSTPTA